ncbi:MAG: acetyl-CoA carboxylase biotin carboxylase subunit [Acidimicrobiales bacterium]
MTERRLERIFIANRGEIAKRIIRTCRKLGIETVLAVSECDRASWAAMMADTTICIGPSTPARSYLDIPRLIAAATAAECDALHPGYGFLAERADLARACVSAGLVFIGPSANVLEVFGNKVTSRTVARAAGVPVLPGSEAIRTGDAAGAVAEQIGFPVLIKAVAGGGGKGIRMVATPAVLSEQFAIAQREADATFGNGRVYLERYVGQARHVEVQVVGASNGNYIHLGDRDCTIQRNHQKLLEEAPAPGIPDGVRERLHDVALNLARYAKIDNLATVEFLYDTESDEFYFLEVNPRIQVEHGVTEMITGVDLVEIQLQAAMGEFALAQIDIRYDGHAIEARVNAEDPKNNFRPSPGRLTRWREPTAPHIRVDSHCYVGYDVPPYYDSLLAKVMAHASDRLTAAARLSSALRRMEIDGVETTRALASSIIDSTTFQSCRHTTTWLQDLVLSATVDSLSRF